MPSVNTSFDRLKISRYPNTATIKTYIIKIIQTHFTISYIAFIYIFYFNIIQVDLKGLTEIGLFAGNDIEVQ